MTLHPETLYQHLHLHLPQVAVHHLSAELLVTVEAALLIRLSMEGHQEAVKVSLFSSPPHPPYRLLFSSSPSPLLLSS